MSLQTSQPGSNRLPVLAATINEHLEAAEAATRRGLEHAIAVGALLIEAKELVAHGEWLPWLQANCRVSERSAQVYSRFRAADSTIARTIAFLLRHLGNRRAANGGSKRRP
jgi:Protein of unknown function (DUF3102)